MTLAPARPTDELGTHPALTQYSPSTHPVLTQYSPSFTEYSPSTHPVLTQGYSADGFAAQRARTGCTDGVLEGVLSAPQPPAHSLRWGTGWLRGYSRGTHGVLDKDSRCRRHGRVMRGYWSTHGDARCDSGWWGRRSCGDQQPRHLDVAVPVATAGYSDYKRCRTGTRVCGSPSRGLGSEVRVGLRVRHGPNPPQPALRYAGYSCGTVSTRPLRPAAGVLFVAHFTAE